MTFFEWSGMGIYGIYGILAEARIFISKDFHWKGDLLQKLG
jgi:hypothetical protein